MEMSQQRILRRLSPNLGTVPGSPPRSTTLQAVPSKQELQLLELAAKLGYCCLPKHKLVKELVRAIVRRLKPRTTTNVYQCVSFTLAGFPLTIAKDLFPDAFLTKNAPSMRTWCMSSLSAVIQVFAPILSEHDIMTAGISKALMTASQRWSRVLATIISAEVSWVTPAQGVDRLYVNFMYVLADEAGELHLPKDASRRELAVSLSFVEQIRAQVLSDAALLVEKGAQLSAGWFTQLGLLSKAMEVRALQANFAAMQVPRAAWQYTRVASGGSFVEGTPSRQRQKRAVADLFEVDAVVEAETRGRTRGLWVRWIGYSPDWEAWRVEGRGEPGDALVTWEPEANLKNTEAYRVWMTSQ